MRQLLLCVLLAAFTLVPAALACDGSCKTTVTVVDCADAPVADATVTVTCRSDGQEVAARTNAQGEAIVHVCTSDIISIGVTAASVEGKGVCPSSPCVVRLCYSSGEETITVIEDKPPATFRGVFILNNNSPTLEMTGEDSHCFTAAGS